MKQLLKNIKKAYIKRINTLYSHLFITFPFLNTAIGVKDPSVIINGILSDLIGWAQGVSVGVATIYGIFGGFKFMSGDPQESLSGKKGIQNAVFGLVLVFTMSTIMSIISSKAQAWKG